MTFNSEEKSKRLNVSSGNKWEDLVGYSRVVKVGNIIEVAGTTATDENGKVVGPNNVYVQARYIFQKIESYLKSVGASLDDVVRTRMFVTDINFWQEIGKAHNEFFHDIKPAASMLEVSRLIDPELLIEIEVTAIIN